ncbi:MAG: hypothetical protein A2X94_14880 [Bdellovibrionales bacterium GWB1_55_8]|nr:MAG: hypothetical protein A2X94_14880 [Bdellovibrionales bacterium GWB1_55_8]
MTDGDHSDSPTPRQLALNRISARECSASDVRAYLKRKGVAAEVARETVEELVRAGYVDDERFSRAMLRTQAARDKGPAYIAAKLAAKGVRRSGSDVRLIFEETAGVSEELLIQKVIARRYADKLGTPENRQRVFQSLLRRGFSPDAIRAALRTLESKDR